QKSHVNYSELLQLAKGWGNFISDRIIIWRLLWKGQVKLKIDNRLQKEDDCLQSDARGFPPCILFSRHNHQLNHV
ncbi:MAG: hypothetical protein ACLVKG_26490, partial [Blautia coccoides]